MTKKLEGKIALVTGAGRGVGRAISTALAVESATVILAARAMHKLKQTADLVKEAGGVAEIVELELADEESIKNCIKTVADKFGRLDILINNAGITHSAKLEETAIEDWDRCFAVNARGPFIMCRGALQLLKKSKEATIINISSVVGIKGYPLQSAYTASKHALRGMSISLSEELRGTNIRVHVLCPGGINTEMVSRVRPDIKTDELIDPAEIAELVIYLLTHKGNAVIDELRIRRETASPWF
jgi:NAD(P)-dependent dehydrogenase (short-subunit alcohol dehydrogenase family)